METAHFQLDDLQLLRKINGEVVESIKRKHLAKTTNPHTKNTAFASNDLTVLGKPPLFQYKTRSELKAKIRESHKQIAKNIVLHNAKIIPRTQAHNRKCEYKSVEAERLYRLDALSNQIKTWRSILPNLIGSPPIM